MKNTIILSALLFVSIWISAQSTNVQNTIVYSLPKTVLAIEVETEKTTYTQGIFYQYAGRYLSAKDVITEDRMQYSLKEIRVKTQAIPDENRTYSLSWSNPKSILYNVAINEKGILCRINTACEPAPEPVEKAVKRPAATEKLSLIPMSEEHMLVSSTAKLAEGAARQILRIRENRLSLLSGEVEHFPDGTAFTLLLEEMEKKERELTELFVGKVTRETHTSIIYYTPENRSVNDILFRLSSINGVVATNDLSGAPYYINIATTDLQLTTAAKASKKNPIIRTIYPAVARVSVTNGRVSYFSQEFSMPQFGSIVELTEDVLRDKDVKVRIDAETGRLLGVE